MENTTIATTKYTKEELVKLAAEKGYTLVKQDIWYFLFDENMNGQGKFSKMGLIAFLTEPIKIEPGTAVNLSAMSTQQRDLVTLQMMERAANVAAE